MMRRSAISDSTLEILDECIGLELSAERRQALLPVFNGMVLPMLEGLDAVDVGEIPPAQSFDPRWQEQA